MATFQVVKIETEHPLPAWVPARLAAQGVDFRLAPCASVTELARHAGEADVVWLFSGMRLLQGEALAALRRCGAILRTGSGTDNVDVARATALGILVANTPYVMADNVADQTIALLFDLVRHVARYDRRLRAHGWLAPYVRPHRRFAGATWGLVAFGQIPRRIVGKLSGFGITFLAYDPYASAEALAAANVQPVSLGELLARSDYVSLHCPYTPETHHLLGEKELRQMQPHALLVNTARSKVVDEAALVRALQEGWIAGAGLDVFEQEPIAPDHPLLAMDHVVLTPHYAGFSDRFPDDSYEASVEAIVGHGPWPLALLGGEPPWAAARWGHLA